MNETDDTAHARANRFARKLVAILHADVQGYSRLIHDDEIDILQLLTPALELLRAFVRHPPNSGYRPQRVRQRSGSPR